MENKGIQSLYKNRTDVKRPNSFTSFTAPMICEIKKAMNDVVYFAEHFYWIVHSTKGKQLIELYDFQKKILQHYTKNRFSIVCSSRQVGKCFLGDQKITVRNKKTGEIKEIDAESFYNMIKSENISKKS